MTHNRRSRAKLYDNSIVHIIIDEYNSGEVRLSIKKKIKTGKE